MSETVKEKIFKAIETNGPISRAQVDIIVGKGRQITMPLIKQLMAEGKVHHHSYNENYHRLYATGAGNGMEPDRPLTKEVNIACPSIIKELDAVTNAYVRRKYA